MMNRVHEPTYAPQITEIGQLQRYTPYERLPIATSAGEPKNRRAVNEAGCTTTAMTISDRTETPASCHRYNERSVRCAKVNAYTRRTAAAAPAVSNATVTKLRRGDVDFHGRHRKAAPAPSSNP